MALVLRTDDGILSQFDVRQIGCRGGVEFSMAGLWCVGGRMSHGQEELMVAEKIRSEH